MDKKRLALVFLMGIMPQLAVYRAYQGSVLWIIITAVYAYFCAKDAKAIAKHVSPFVLLPPFFLLVALVLSDAIDRFILP